MVWNNLLLKEITSICPQQFNVFYEDEYVGYIRIRHGYLSVEDSEGNEVWGTFEIDGNGMLSIEEHDRVLQKCKMALEDHYRYKHTESLADKIYEDIARILTGIDGKSSDSAYGYWETNAGVDRGESILKEIKNYLNRVL